MVRFVLHGRHHPSFFSGGLSGAKAAAVAALEREKRGTPATRTGAGFLLNIQLNYNNKQIYSGTPFNDWQVRKCAGGESNIP